ncbi:polysaccharide deacetylase family protein [Halalkalibacter akibai]|uniref:Polysaccharide deacetylase n=1 Tax=Halalkalibacter akibai (strain ATCC 43226 / DSM 21942 / CIP 109018 / JCM 9157 / 1139) TaxID=1236973 RepID=W4QM47_HALA3|nr:polysaccharide deacetylase family protein [Halalkalibacter akibai]GAE33200.1 polysaccharide deacetylase [Halalkalibacter akibai JCM 9157]
MMNKHSIESNLNLCAFTFDDGPDLLPLELWLDSLEELSARATFFFTGEWIDRNQDKARLLISRGHELAPHSYHHRNMSELNQDQFFEELKQTELAYQEATGMPCPLLLRFPYLNFNQENLKWISDNGYVHIGGDDTGDWAGLKPEQIIKNAEPLLKNGAILVLHCNDIAKGTPAALKPLLRKAIKDELTPVKVSDMLKAVAEPPRHRTWKIVINVPTTSLNEDSYQDWAFEDKVEPISAETFDWGVKQTLMGIETELEWQRHLSESLRYKNVLEDRQLFSSWQKTDDCWGFARFGVDQQQLVLLDFFLRESAADALVYVLRWAAKIAQDLGCKQIVARKDMRRLHKMCEQLSWESDIIID